MEEGNGIGGIGLKGDGMVGAIVIDPGSAEGRAVDVWRLLWYGRHGRMESSTKRDGRVAALQPGQIESARAVLFIHANPPCSSI